MQTPFGPRAPRVPFVRPLSLTPVGEDEKSLRLYAANLSRGGMFVQTDHLLPRGTRVVLALEAGGLLLDFAEGEVVWERDDDEVAEGDRGFGLRFTRLRDRSLALVEHLVARGGTACIVQPAAKAQSLPGL